jgi:hypothetical protein
MNDKKLRDVLRIIIITMTALTSTLVFSQLNLDNIKISPTVGFTLNHSTMNDGALRIIPNRFSKFGVLLGVDFRQYLENQNYLGLVFAYENRKVITTPDTSNVGYSTRLSEISLKPRYGYSLSSGWSLITGPSLSYILSAKSKNSNYSYSFKSINNFQYGLFVGIEKTINFEKLILNNELIYQASLRDLFRSKDLNGEKIHSLLLQFNFQLK